MGAEGRREQSRKSPIRREGPDVPGLISGHPCGVTKTISMQITLPGSLLWGEYSHHQNKLWGNKLGVQEATVKMQKDTCHSFSE